MVYRKFKNKPNTINGLQLDSLLERRVYLILVKIFGKSQVNRGGKIRLTKDTKHFKGIFYEPDFIITADNGKLILVEAKGKLINESKLKLKLLLSGEDQHNFIITSDKPKPLFPKWIMRYFIAVDQLEKKLTENRSQS